MFLLNSRCSFLPSSFFHLFYLLGMPGDCCLIPKPYHASYENDMSTVANVEPWGVSQKNPMRGPTVEELQTAYTAARQKGGYRPKFILLNNLI